MTDLFWLLVGHALADFPLQGEFLSASKREGATVCPWWIALTWHSIIHAGVVMLVTGAIELAWLEFLGHWYIDYRKCRGDFGFTADQAMHVTCKIVWAFA